MLVGPGRYCLVFRETFVRNLKFFVPAYCALAGDKDEKWSARNVSLWRNAAA